MSAALLTIREAADRLSVSVRTLEREEADGKFTITRIRSKRLVAPEELERYKLAAQCQSAKSVTAGRSGFELVEEAVSRELSRLERPATTRVRSKLRSAARRSTLRLVESQNG